VISIDEGCHRVPADLTHALTHTNTYVAHDIPSPVTLLMCYDWCQMMNGTEPEMHLSLSHQKHIRHMDAFWYYNLWMKVIFL